MASKNDITGDEIKSRTLSEQGRKNWDNIFKKQSAWRWLEELGYNKYSVLDPDGWRRGDNVTMETPITRSDFYNRLNESTVVWHFIPEEDLPHLNNE